MFPHNMSSSGYRVVPSSSSTHKDGSMHGTERCEKFLRSFCIDNTLLQDHARKLVRWHVMPDTPTYDCAHTLVRARRVLDAEEIP